MRPKFGNPNITMKEFITTLIVSGFQKKNWIFEG